MKILICEDDEIELRVIRMALEEFNLDVSIARDGNKGLQLLAENPDFDLIITDIHMPFKNGDEILTEVKKPEHKNIPVLMISSDSDEDVIKLALRLGVNEFLAKPITPEMVKKKVKKLLKL
ncbi:MAG TPA: response regulator [Cyclobacteriaceae bacterium]